MLRKLIRTKKGCVGHSPRNMLTEIKAPTELFLHSMLLCWVVSLPCLSLLSLLLSFSQPQLCPQRLHWHALLTGQNVESNFLKNSFSVLYLRSYVLDLI